MACVGQAPCAVFHTATWASTVGDSDEVEASNYVNLWCFLLLDDLTL